MSKLYLRGKDIRRIHVRGFKDGSIKCEDETLWPDHFGLITKTSPCSPQIIRKIEEAGYKCLNTDNASWCVIRSNSWNTCNITAISKL